MIDFLKGTVTPKDWVAVGVIVLITALLVVLFVFFVHSWQTKELNAGRELVSAKTAELNKARATQKNFAALKAETDKIQQLVADFEGRLPAQAEIPLLLEQFELIANQVGVSVQLNTLALLEDERKTTIPYAVTANGSFDQIASFINRLERYQRYLRVSDLEIKEEKDGVAEAKFTLSTFVFKQPKPQPAAAPAGAAGGSV